MFRTSIVHLQERSYAVCCNLVCLETSCCYEGEGRTADILQNDTRPIQYQMYESIICNVWAHNRNRCATVRAGPASILSRESSYCERHHCRFFSVLHRKNTLYSYLLPSTHFKMYHSLTSFYYMLCSSEKKILRRLN
jgi:hypothetical protein